MTAPPRSRTDALQEWALVALAVAAVTIAATWPLAKSAWLVPAHQDPLFSSWRLYQWARNLSGQWPGGLFDGNIFAPTRDVLLFSDAIPLLAVPAAPFLWLGVPVVKVYATLVWLSFLGAGLAMYACARELTGSRFGAFVAAVIFTAAPFRIEHVMHLELLWTAWLPLVVLGTVRLFARPGRRCPARRLRAGRPVPVVHLLRRVHDHALAAAGRPRVGPYAAAAVAPAGRHLGRGGCLPRWSSPVFTRSRTSGPGPWSAIARTSRSRSTAP